MARTQPPGRPGRGGKGNQPKAGIRVPDKTRRASKRTASKPRSSESRKRAAGLVPSPNHALIASDPLKAQIVAVALQRPYSPSEFAKDAGVGLNVASYAFKVLKEKGILELVEEVRVRGTIKHMYRATEAALVSTEDWADLAEALRPAFTGTILRDFSVRVTQAIETGHLYSRDDFCLYWAPQDLDEQAWNEQVEIYKWCIEESKRLEQETVERRCNGEGGEGFHATFAIAAFPSPTNSEIKKHQAKAGRRAGKD